MNKEESMFYAVDTDEHRKKFMVFNDNPPQWNPKTNGYHYDFKGRVTEASIKNFQVIPYVDSLKGVNIREYIVQFGRHRDGSFKLDAQYPFSIF